MRFLPPVGESVVGSDDDLAVPEDEAPLALPFVAALDVLRKRGSEGIVVEVVALFDADADADDSALLFSLSDTFRLPLRVRRVRRGSVGALVRVGMLLVLVLLPVPLLLRLPKMERPAVKPELRRSKLDERTSARIVRWGPWAGPPDHRRSRWTRGESR